MITIHSTSEVLLLHVTLVTRQTTCELRICTQIYLDIHIYNQLLQIYNCTFDCSGPLLSSVFFTVPHLVI
jgi:hypothetical protein